MSPTNRVNINVLPTITQSNNLERSLNYAIHHDDDDNNISRKSSFHSISEINTNNNTNISTNNIINTNINYEKINDNRSGKNVLKNIIEKNKIELSLVYI